MPIDLGSKLKAFERFIAICETASKIDEAYERTKTLRDDATDLFDLCLGIMEGKDDVNDNDDDNDNE